MLGELAGEHEADRCLDLTAGEGLLLGVAAELGGLEGDALEDIVEWRCAALFANAVLLGWSTGRFLGPGPSFLLTRLERPVRTPPET